MKLGLARYKLIGARSFNSKKTGMMYFGDEVHRPYLLRSDFPDNLFDVVIVGDTGDYLVKVSGGLGDKIYTLPLMYVLDIKLGIEKRDIPIFRIVKDKVYISKGSEINLLNNLRVDGDELVDQISRNVGLELKLKMPILESSYNEKLSVVSNPNDYVLVCKYASERSRSWNQCDEFIEYLKANEIPFYRVTKKDCNLFPLIEQASCVVTANTCIIPMAGGFQVPVIAIGRNTNRRVKYFLDGVGISDGSLDNVVESFEGMKRRNYVKCWCGEAEGKKSIFNNLWVIDCINCGTRRADIKASKGGVYRFYKNVYHNGWRKLVEGEEGYQVRFDADYELFNLRYIEQWKPHLLKFVKGSRWLDVGCSTGSLVKLLRSDGWKSEGLELDLDMVSLASVNCDSEIHSSWDTVGIYDVISYVDVFEHGFVNEEIIRCLNHLASGGRIICELPIAQEEKKHYRRFQHIFYFTEETFEKFILFHDLEVELIIRPIKGKRTFILKRKGE